MANGEQEIKVYFLDDMKGRAYAGNMVVAHTKEEFVLDFLMTAPLRGR